LLVAGQISLALTLLTGTGLIIKSFWRLQSVDPGFKTDHVVTAGLSLSFADYPNGSPKRTMLFDAALSRLSSLPGVTSVGAISHLPFGGRTMRLPFQIKGQSLNTKNEAVADYRVVTPSFFKTAGIELKKGRTLDDRDDHSAGQVFVVNEAFVRAFLQGQEPIGVQLVGASAFVKGEIVGVVGNVKHKGLEMDAEPAFYVSYRQSSTFPIMNFLVRTPMNPETLTVPVSRELQALDSNAVVFNVRTFEDFIADSTAPHRFNLWLFAAFGTLALLLAAGGIYATVHFAVAQRTREIGIRVALGAQKHHVFRTILGEGIPSIFVGMLFGVFGSVIASHWIQSLLFSVSATDPITYLSICTLLLLVALLASWLPARRALKVDPLICLRHE
jgi:putative ABC transport system permease protein